MTITARARANVCPHSDGTYSFELSITGLTNSEAWQIGQYLGDHVKIAMLKSIRDRLTPSSYVVDRRFNQHEDTQTNDS